MNRFQIITFKDESISLDVKVSVDDGTIWLSAEDLAKLFNVGVSTVRRYIKLTHKGVEIDENEKKPKMDFSCTYSTKSKPITLYNEEIIIGLANKYNYSNIELLKSFIASQKTNKHEQNNFKEETNNIVIYNNGEISLDVNVSPNEETVWLTQEQIAKLFKTTQPNVSMHISNILKDSELDSSIYKDFLYVGANGKHYVVRNYNLDLILAIGYRIKSKRAIMFRKWVSSILKQYLIKGYSVNENRLASYSDNLLRLENLYFDAKKEIEEIKLKIGLKKEAVFDSGQFYDAYAYIKDLIMMAKNSVYIFDPYFDNNALNYLKDLNTDIKKKIYLTHLNLLNKKIVKNFKKQYGQVNFYSIRQMHDRFVIIDETRCYLIGASLNYAGKSLFAVIKLESNEILNLLLNRTTKVKEVFTN